jgi:hypothetical protein
MNCGNFEWNLSYHRRLDAIRNNCVKQMICGLW